MMSWKRSILMLLVSWLIPGSGHFLLKKKLKAVLFFVIITIFFTLGIYLKGQLYTPDPAFQRTIFATVGELGAGIFYLLSLISGYKADPSRISYDYGTAFLLTAGILNWLLVLDVWLVISGEKQ